MVLGSLLGDRMGFCTVWMKVKCVNYIAGLPLFGQATVRCDSENVVHAQALAIKWGKSLASG